MIEITHDALILNVVFMLIPMHVILLLLTGVCPLRT